MSRGAVGSSSKLRAPDHRSGGGASSSRERDGEVVVDVHAAARDHMVASEEFGHCRRDCAAERAHRRRHRAQLGMEDRQRRKRGHRGKRDKCQRALERAAAAQLGAAKTPTDERRSGVAKAQNCDGDGADPLVDGK